MKKTREGFESGEDFRAFFKIQINDMFVLFSNVAVCKFTGGIFCFIFKSGKVDPKMLRS